MEPKEVQSNTAASRLESIQERLADLEAERRALLDDLRKIKHAALREGTLPSLDDRKYPETPGEKVALFQRMFVARRDVYPRLWVNEQTGRKGYSPVCRAVWGNGRRLKPTENYAKYGPKNFVPLSADVIESHLRGQQVIGTYALRQDDRCVFLAADFDGDGWQSDVVAYRDAAASLGVSCLAEISRSGNGAHAWVFFSEPVKGSHARALGSLILARAARDNPHIRLDTYDRFFPNQDTLPKSGFGNLIALPLQKDRRTQGFTEYVDESLAPFPDQWKILSEIPRFSGEDVRNLLEQHVGEAITDETPTIEREELILESSRDDPLSLPVLPDWKVYLSDAVIIPTTNLPDGFLARLKGLATIPNPIFFEKQRQRFPTYNIPRCIFSGAINEDRIVLPRGCLEDVTELFAQCGSRIETEDRRLRANRIQLKFTGRLTHPQTQALKALRDHDWGVLVAPPGAGKTVIACALIGSRKTTSLILVSRQTLLEQWLKRLNEFLSAKDNQIGQWRGTRKKLTGKIDVVMLQSLAKTENPKAFFRNYGSVIVDECHHIPAVTLEALMKECESRHITGLTATPKRKDGLERLLYQQCGPIRHAIAEDSETSLTKQVIIRNTPFRPPTAPNQQVLPLHLIWQALIRSPERNGLIAGDIEKALNEGRKPIVLSDRKEHLATLKKEVENLDTQERFCLVSVEGSLIPKQRAAEFDRFTSAIKSRKPACLFATASLLGEGFDLPMLDTLFLAMPVSFKGRLIQYVGRLHRKHEGKETVTIYDYLDKQLALTASMYRKRSAGYRQLGYRILHDPIGSEYLR